jgi:PAS domain S-box-containing protein
MDGTSPKAFENDIRRNEQRLRTILEQTSDGIMLLDSEGRILSVAHPILGKNTEGAIGRDSLEQVHPDDRELARELLAESARAPGQIRKALLRSRRSDGTSCWLETSCRSLLEDPEVGALVVSYRDVTASLAGEQRIRELLEQEQAARLAAEQAERDHREMRQKLRLLIDASGALVGNLDRNDVLRRILSLATELIPADAYAVWQADSETSEWRVIASRGLSEQYVAETLRAGVPQATQALRHAIVVEDVAQSPSVADRRSLYASEGIRSFLAAPLRVRESVLGTITLYFRQPHRFAEIEIELATALANLAASVLDTSELYERQMQMRTQAQISEQRSHFLAEAISILSSSLDYETTLANVARLAVPQFADWCAVDIANEKGIERLAIAHVDPQKIAVAQEFRRRYVQDSLGDPAVAQAVRTGKSQVYSDITDQMLAASARDDVHLAMLRELGLRSVLVVPMIVRSKILGAITFVSSRASRLYSEDYLETAEQLAGRAALAIDNARLYQTAEAEKAEAQATAAALQASNADLEQFAYVVSHDLQEPLRAISNFTELLVRRYREVMGAEADEIIDYIVTSVRRMSAMIRDVLLYSRHVSDPIDDNEVTDAMIAMEQASFNLQTSIDESRAQISISKLPEVRITADQLTLVFQNLIGNSIKYRKPDTAPHIEVTAERLGRDWRFSIKDNGIGFEPEFAERIFGVFKRLHLADAYPGTGIGLAIVRKIIERHHGCVWANATPGEGATFGFTLPAVRSEPLVGD